MRLRSLTARSASGHCPEYAQALTAANRGEGLHARRPRNRQILGPASRALHGSLRGEISDSGGPIGARRFSVLCDYQSLICSLSAFNFVSSLVDFFIARTSCAALRQALR